MATINNIINHFFSWLWLEFLALLGILTDGWAGLVILLVILIILAVVKKIIKIPVWQKVIDVASGIITILLVIVIGLYAYWFFTSLPKNSGSSTPSNSSESSGSKSTTPSTQSTPEQTTPSQTQKQLYYSTSCSNCYAEGCNRNGYSYGGYSEENYLYYKSFCDQCSCADKKSQTFWK